MADIRSWMDEIRSRFNKKVYALLIVEPLKTSFPFYNIQKGKLKREAFPIVIDKHGEMLQRFELPDVELRMLIVDKKSDIKTSLSGSYNEEHKQIFFHLLERLTGKQYGSEK